MLRQPDFITTSGLSSNGMLITDDLDDVDTLFMKSPVLVNGYKDDCSC
jgi:hypothetical protein